MFSDFKVFERKITKIISQTIACCWEKNCISMTVVSTITASSFRLFNSISDLLEFGLLSGLVETMQLQILE